MRLEHNFHTDTVRRFGQVKMYLLKGQETLGWREQLPVSNLFVFSGHLKAFLICREILHCMKLSPVERILRILVTIKCHSWWVMTSSAEGYNSSPKRRLRSDANGAGYQDSWSGVKTTGQNVINTKIAVHVIRRVTDEKEACRTKLVASYISWGKKRMWWHLANPSTTRN